MYVEGTFTKSLLEPPEDMFDDMASLTFIHLGMHVRLQRLPSFDGLINLKALTLALFFSVTELAAFDSLKNLERLLLIGLSNADTLPDLRQLDKLKTFTVNDRGSWCCNGFLGECNLEDSFCTAQPYLGIPPASCLQPNAPRATNETLAIIRKFSATVCREVELKVLPPGPPTPEGIAQCEGILYQMLHSRF